MYKKISFIIIAICLLVGCEKKRDVYCLVNTTTNIVTISTNRSMLEEHLGIRKLTLYFVGYFHYQPTEEIKFIDDVENDTSVLFHYKGKVYEERSAVNYSILHKYAYFPILYNNGDPSAFAFEITEKYILSLPRITVEE
ncbi:MAG: hypothetical protein LBS50_10885 [Prevotellaceae bacterium]|jgi:hypothetical protein|nr:hypothetical protein [Prevotellaceae bacterium]